ncbi:ParA family protein [Brevibacillus sp. NPDC058079]|uniref:ParA family protein n=1 Tax=Brevibacillus sp. NPDC058079 TaxID=3346330 RepID=UPI0036EBFF05
MATTISIGIQKGGSGKSTTSSIVAYLLSQKHKVLAVDMDGQGNLTQLLTGVEDIFEFDGNTVYDAIMEEDATNHIIKINDKLHILAGDENINTLGPYFHVTLPQAGKVYATTLKHALEKVSHLYDYIIIDNPPALGEISICSLTASDFVVVMFETSKFCHSSLLSYLKTIEAVQEKLNNDLKVAGILRAMIDNRRSDNKYYAELIQEEFKEICFKTIIQRTAVVGRLPAFGIIGNPELKQVVKQYEPFFKELMKNVKHVRK